MDDGQLNQEGSMEGEGVRVQHEVAHHQRDSREQHRVIIYDLK